MATEALNHMTEFERGAGAYEQARLGRVITAMVTPMKHDGAVNYEAAQNLAQYLQQNGSDALVVAGTTGEAPALTHAEQIQLITEVSDAVSVPIIAGTGSNSTQESVWLTERVTENDTANAVLVVSPYYNRPSQEGILDYYERVAAATDLPVIIYDIPARTGRKVDTNTILQLVEEIPNIEGLKDAAGDTDETARLISLLRSKDLLDKCQVYSGDDARNVALYRAGAVGAISVASHWAGPEMSALYKELARNDEVFVSLLQGVLAPSFAFESTPDAPNPIPAKAMMRLILGQEIGISRSPMVVSSETMQEVEMRAEKIRSQLVRMREVILGTALEPIPR